MSQGLSFQKLMFRNKQARAQGKEPKIFDWDKAARLIREWQPNVAAAGLQEDWFWTGMDIYRDGRAIDKDEVSMFPYTKSCWATPILVLDGEEIACWIPASAKPEQNANTYWPKSALNILRRTR